MFDFFTTLFGGTYYTGKYIAGKIDKRIEDEWREKSIQTQESIISTPEREKQIVDDFKNPRQKKKLLVSISNELSQVYGERWGDFFDSEEEVNYICLSNPEAIAIHLLLSKEGKVPYMFASRYELGGLGEKRMRYAIKACELIEKNIQKTRPDLKMMFVPGTKITDKKYAEFYEEMYMGSIYWEHNIPLSCKKWNPPVRRLW